MATKSEYLLSVCCLCLAIFQKILFIFRDGKRGREGEKHQCVVASCTPPTGDLAYSAGICPDWESNQRLFGSQAGAQSTEPHQPGPDLLFSNLSVLFVEPYIDLDTVQCMCMYSCACMCVCIGLKYMWQNWLFLFVLYLEVFQEKDSYEGYSKVSSDDRCSQRLCQRESRPLDTLVFKQCSSGSVAAPWECHGGKGQAI